MAVIFNAVIQILTLIGAIGLFLYGMKVMSESLQKMAGTNIRNWLNRNISSPRKGILAGTLLTATVQSSSAVTVMLISFVNAGLISFNTSLGILFGANIGTTVTAWIISLAGINSGFDFYMIILPLTGFSIPWLLSSKNLNRFRAEFIIGFAILFIGIFLFKQHIPQIDETSGIFQGLHALSKYKIINTIVFIFAGIAITTIFQSSSATIALTMVLAAQGWLSLNDALAMVIGENIGTTLTAILASMIANRTAKRTALAHLFFNIFGALWAFILFDFYNLAIEESITLIQSFSGKSAEAIIPIGIAIFHTSFNVINTLLLMLFFNYFKDFCYMVLPNDSNKEDFELKFIDTGMISVSEISVVQVKMEVSQMGLHTLRLFRMIPDLLKEKNEKKFRKKIQEINKLKNSIDKLNNTIANYITKMFQSNLSEKGSHRLRTLLKIIDNLENTADMCSQMSLTILGKNETAAWFTPELRRSLDQLMNLIEKALVMMNDNLNANFGQTKLDQIKSTEQEINTLRNDLKKIYLDGLKQNEYPYQTGIIYNELVGLLEKVGNYIYNINFALYSVK
ncbi:MAG TPA: Na/Pi cotransporter family protein [Bacteroidales bacterium]|nr:Na/Pi cotransporter family protein [Bacteroidales bacterium]